MIPARSLVLLALVPIVLAILTLWDKTLLWPMLATDLGIALVALADALLARRGLIAVKRHARDVFSVGQPNLVTLDLRSSSRRKLRVALRDDLFEGAESDELPIELELAPHGRASVRYHVRPTRRGAYALGDHWLRYASPLGLWIRQQRITADKPIKVFPDVAAVRTYDLLARQNREQSMFRSSRRRGGESEFERLRDYQREDEYRAIDWKATARRRKLIAREYQLESNQSIMFVLDAGRLMTAETGGLSLFDHALNATLMLSHVAVRNGDQVGLLTFADDVKSYAPPSAGRRATQAIIQAGYHLHPEIVESNYGIAFDQLSARVRKRTLVVLFTQVVDEAAARELLRLTRGLLPRHLPLWVLFRDVDVERLLEPAQADDVLSGYVRSAAAEVLSWRERVARELKKQGALILDVAPQRLTPALINRYLEVKARHLL
ncbi:MAG TPA: DUF58 domain-containing protein [Polyangiaceae bacterium]|jgi:uncharacterized protein (DUF58 family)|nr:DUF58 domain-containing protein [Polyangiaceae bacterium]